ncbi:MAG: hypothetical protein ACXAAH_06890, partial [Promethearchaeota archaeon]
MVKRKYFGVLLLLLLCSAISFSLIKTKSIPINNKKFGKRIKINNNSRDTILGNDTIDTINDVLNQVLDDILQVLFETLVGIGQSFIVGVGTLFTVADMPFLIEPLIAGALLWIDRWIFAVNEL